MFTMSVFENVVDEDMCANSLRELQLLILASLPFIHNV
jgi:hypothetical protein